MYCDLLTQSGLAPQPPDSQPKWSVHSPRLHRYLGKGQRSAFQGTWLLLNTLYFHCFSSMWPGQRKGTILPGSLQSFTSERHSLKTASFHWDTETSSPHLHPSLPWSAAGGYVLIRTQQAEAGPSILISVGPSGWLLWRPRKGQKGPWSLSNPLPCLVLSCSITFIMVVHRLPELQHHFWNLDCIVSHVLTSSPNCLTVGSHSIH